MDETDHVLAKAWADLTSFPSLKVSRQSGGRHTAATLSLNCCQRWAAEGHTLASSSGLIRLLPPSPPAHTQTASPQSLVVFPGNKGVCHPDPLAPQAGHYDVMDTFFTRFNGVVVSGRRGVHCKGGCLVQFACSRR